MIISLLVAVDEKNGIGKDGKLPWHLSEDLKMFKQLTMGHHMLMGRKTYESIGQLLSGRISLILTRSRSLAIPGATLVHSLEEGIELAKKAKESELFIIGGGEVFRLALPVADRIYLTTVQTDAHCQVFFPEINCADWVERERSFHPADEKNDFSFYFSLLERKN